MHEKYWIHRASSIPWSLTRLLRLTTATATAPPGVVISRYIPNAAVPDFEPCYIRSNLTN